MSYHHTIACNTCEEIGPMIRQSGDVYFVARRGDQLLTGDQAQTVWSDWLSDHRYHDLALLGEGYNPELPARGWTPRPAYGPPESGRVADQVVTCSCSSTNTVVLTVDRGADWFRRCRDCGNMWGPAVDRRDAVDRLQDRPSTAWRLPSEADPTPVALVHSHPQAPALHLPPAAPPLPGVPTMCLLDHRHGPGCAPTP